MAIQKNEHAARQYIIFVSSTSSKLLQTYDGSGSCTNMLPVHQSERCFTYIQLVIADFNAKRCSQRLIERKPGSRNQNVLSSISQCRYGQVHRSRPATGKNDVLRTNSIKTKQIIMTPMRIVIYDHSPWLRPTSDYCLMMAQVVKYLGEMTARYWATFICRPRQPIDFTCFVNFFPYSLHPSPPSFLYLSPLVLLFPISNSLSLPDMYSSEFLDSNDRLMVTTANSRSYKI